MRGCWLLLLLLVSCAYPAQSSPSAREEWVLAVDPLHPAHARVEGTGLKNDCTADAQCAVGGCSREICSAETDVTSTCELPVGGWPTKGASCGCVQGQCVWYRAAGPTPEGTAPAPGGAPRGVKAMGRGEPCTEAACASGLTCVSYFGIAGPSGPRFASCETPCPQDQCPEGLKCVTIADGPAKVCR